MKFAKHMLAAVVLACTAVPVASANVITFQQGLNPSGTYDQWSKDAYIIGSTTGTGSATALITTIGLTAGRTYRGYLGFDISSIPAGASISSASLTVVNSTAGVGADSVTIGLYQLTQAFTEADMTWTKATASTNWTTGGGDYNSTALASITAVPSTTYGQFSAMNFSGSGFTSAVQSAYAAGTNLYLLARFQTEPTTGKYVWCSDDYGVSPAERARRPLLTVNYSVPEPTSLGLLALGATAMLARRRKS